MNMMMYVALLEMPEGIRPYMRLYLCLCAVGGEWRSDFIYGYDARLTGLGCSAIIEVIWRTVSDGH